MTADLQKPAAGPIIRAVNLTRRFDALIAVDRFNLEVAPGEIVGIVGPDGAGKTTTLRMLCGLVDPSEGEAWVTGRNVASEPDAVKDQIGYMAQRFGLYGDLTVNENMHFYADLFDISKSERGELMPRLLRMTRMEPFGKRMAKNLSGGMKQKLALMCTLLHHPQVLFLDEPTNGVDPVSRRDFWAILYQLVRGGLTVLITTAYLDEAERCNRVGLMNRGRLIRCESPRALRRALAETCYELETPDQIAAREFLVSQPGVLSVDPAGATLHLFLAAGTNSPEMLQAGLAARGVAAGNFRPIVPSLEDVYIGLVRKEAAANAG